MNKLSIFIMIGLWCMSLPVISDCKTVKEYWPKVNMYVDNIVGTHDCVMEPVMKADSMLAGYWVEDKTKTLFLVINNIRMGKDIDLDYYGFNDKYRESLLKDMTDIEDVKLLRRYTWDGSSQPQIENNLSKAGWVR